MRSLRVRARARACRELNKNKQLAPAVQPRDAAHSDVNKTSHLPTLASVKFFSFLEMIRKEKGMEPYRQ